ncbi:MAG TPA: BON domain-containing protein [Burkholderiales bacterium]|nr:BON domain-containing protein [Burkholderiales bacterium]
MKRWLALVSVVLFCGTALAARLAHPTQPRITDAELAGKVRGALHASLGDPAGRIDVAVQDGFVFLYGKVPNERLRARAETVAGRVGGVRSVNNELILTRDRATFGRMQSLPVRSRAALYVA